MKRVKRLKRQTGTGLGYRGCILGHVLIRFCKRGMLVPANLMEKRNGHFMGTVVLERERES